MKKVVSILLTILSALYYSPCFAQEIIAKPMPFFSDLTSNEIWDIFQDNTGYLWIGTSNGVARYDGYHLQTFRNDYRSPHLLTDNHISDFAENEQYIWIGTRKGLNLYDRKTFQMQPVPDKELCQKNIECIVPAKNKQVWVASEGIVYRCDSLGNILRSYRMREVLKTQSTSPVINSIYEDKSGTIWALLGKNGLCKYDAKRDTFTFFTGMIDIDYFIMFQDKNGRYWIGSWGDGFWRFQPESKEGEYFIPCPIMNQKSKKNEELIYSITQDNSFNYLWVLSYNELYALDVTDDREITPVNIEDKVDTHKMYTRITKDREGNLWLGSYDMANLVSFDHSGIRHYSVPQLKKDFGWDTNILHLCMDEEDVVWLSQDRLGLCLYNLKEDELTYANLSGKIQEINLMMKSYRRMAVWISDRNRPHIMRLVRRGNTLVTDYELMLNSIQKNCGSVTQLLEDAAANLWVMTEHNLFIVPSNHKPILCKDLRQIEVSHLSMDQTGNVWAISTSNRVVRLQLDDELHVQQHSAPFSTTPEESAQFSCIDYEGCLWIASSSGLIFKSDKGKDKFKLVSFDGALDDCTILKMLIDKQYLWIVTNKKILKYNLRTQSFLDYATTDPNVRVHLFRGQAACSDGVKGIYAGGHNGFIHIDGRKDAPLYNTEIIPEVTDIKVNNQSIFFEREPAKNTIRKVFLSPNERNIEIFLSSLEYGLQKKRRIAVKLEGIDKDWGYLNADKHSAFYNKLPKGTYSFRIKYADEANNWTECTSPLVIVQLPSWYETWVAYTIYFLLVLGIGYWAQRYYLNHLKKKNAAKLKEELSRVMDLSTQPKAADKKFLQQIADIVKAHLEESEFDLDHLSKELNMSKSTLHRKMKAITGLTPLDFIRNIKMKQACRMLTEHELSISEIAYALGFTNPKYFTKCFKEEFGMTPTEYQSTPRPPKEDGA